MVFETDNFIHVPNPEFPQDDFRKNNKGEINQVGTINFGSGITGLMGILKGSGKEAPFSFLFEQVKWTLEKAKNWLDKYKGSKLCIECIENFENGDVWIRAEVTAMNEEFDDERVIVGLDIPENKDILVRDLHSDGFTKVVGITNSDKIFINKDGVLIAKWKVTDADLEKLVKSAKNPQDLFKYSPELKNPIRDGKKRSGVLDSFVITENPAWLNSRTTDVWFEKAEISSEHFDKDVFETAKALIEQGLIVDDGISNQMYLTDDFPIGTEGSINKAALKGVVENAKDISIVEEAKKLSKMIEIKEEKDMAEDKEKLELVRANQDLKRDKELFESQLKASQKDSEKFQTELKDLKEKFASEKADLEKERDDFKEKFELKGKDYDDLKKDADADRAKVEKFETAMKEARVKEVFELGVKIGRYKKEDEEKEMKELFEISDERLEEKKENFEFAQKLIPAHVLRQPSEKGGSGEMSDKDAFNSVF